MEADGHDPVRVVEGLFDSITVVDVDVEVQDAGVHAEEFEYADDDIVDVAEPTGLSFLGVVVAAGPVYDDIAQTGHNGVSSVNTAPHR